MTAPSCCLRSTSKALSSPALVHGNSHRHKSRRYGAQAGKLETIFNLTITLNIQVKRKKKLWTRKHPTIFFGLLSSLKRDREPPQKPFITCFSLIVENNHPCQERLWSLHCWKYSENIWPYFHSTGSRWPCLIREVGPDILQRSLPVSIILCFCDIPLDAHFHGTNGCLLQ